MLAIMRFKCCRPKPKPQQAEPEPQPQPQHEAAVGQLSTTSAPTLDTFTA